MPNYTLNTHQLSINVQQLSFSLAEYITTRKLRTIVQEIAGISLTARKIEQQGKEGRFEVGWARGIFVISTSSQASPNRLLRWDLYYSPNYIYPAA